MAPTTLSDIGQAADFCASFISNLQFIFQYCAKDVQDELYKQDMETLLDLHKMLTESVQKEFSELNSKRPINRQSKTKAVSDIFSLGYSLVNKSPAKELDKIFIHNAAAGDAADQTQQTIDTDEFAELLLTVASMRQELSTLQDTVVTLSTDNTKLKELVQQLQGSSNAQTATPGNMDVPNALTSGLANQQPQAESEGTPTPVTSPADQDGVQDDVVPSQSTSSSTSDSEGEYVQQPRHRKKRHRRAENQKDTDAAQDGKGRRPLMSAAPAPTNTTPLYIGGVHPSHSVADVERHLCTLGLNIKATIRCLRDKQDWKSFVADIPSSMTSAITDKNLWPKGIRVRPFHEIKTQNQRPGVTGLRSAGGPQSRRPAQNHQHSNRRQSRPAQQSRRASPRGRVVQQQNFPQNGQGGHSVHTVPTNNMSQHGAGYTTQFPIPYATIAAAHEPQHSQWYLPPGGLHQHLPATYIPSVRTHMPGTNQYTPLWW